MAKIRNTNPRVDWEGIENIDVLRRPNWMSIDEAEEREHQLELEQARRNRFTPQKKD